MNADMLKRVVRAISDGSQHDLQRLAKKIVDLERRTGHLKLADQLEAILNQPRPKRIPQRPSGDSDRHLRELPLSRRHGESLATILPTESLEHNMVLPPATEERFERIEREFAARSRLGFLDFSRVRQYSCMVRLAVVSRLGRNVWRGKQAFL